LGMRVDWGRLLLTAVAAFVLIREGQKVAEGVPEKVITKELLREVYRVDAEIIHHQVSGKPMVLPLGLVKTNLE
jgi:ABC-type cobalamin/Fe3+-siderophores transport system ATPase subunit